MKAGYWKTSCWQKLRAKATKQIKAECRRIEPREEKQAACWNYLYKRRAPSLRRKYKKGICR